MPVQTKVEFLKQRTEHPVYYASSAGRDAAHEIDQQMNIVTVEVDDARGRGDSEQRDEFGMHASGFDLLEFPTRVENFLDPSLIESIYEAEIESFLQAVTGC